MASKTRVPNKTQWALQDILDECIGARRHWQKLMKMAEANMDPAMMLYLAKNRDAWAQVEKLTLQAMNGEYYQEGE